MFGFIITVLLLPAITHGVVTGCPTDWETYGTACYKFVWYPLRSFLDAEAACNSMASGLVSVDDLAEHTFISGILEKADTRRLPWYTSGLVTTKSLAKQQDTITTDLLLWEGDGTDFNTEILHLWNPHSNNLPDQPAQAQGNAIIYEYFITPFTGYGFGRSKTDVLRPYICEIPEAEVYRIYEQRRGYGYGTDVVNLNDIQRGPTITEQPHDIVILADADAVFVDCVATGNPMPTYKWYKLLNSRKIEITSELSTRFVITGGRFTINGKHNVSADRGEYQCEAMNEFGVALSNPIEITFGELAQFSNVRREKVNVHEYKGAVVQCQPPRHKPGVAYQWFRDTPENFVRPEHQTYIFVSDNGKMYFSEVTKVDEGEYHCVVTLGGPYDMEKLQNFQGKSQAPSRTSLPIPMFVLDAGQTAWGPQIQDDFIQILPQTPLRGQTVRLECFAYGTMPIFYSWSRIDGPFPSKVTYHDSARVIHIPDVQFEDGGTYRCTARRYRAAVDTKDAHLKVAAKPYFEFPLRNQHLDVGGALTWRCAARAVPSATYVWYKNGVPIVSEPGVIETNRFILKIPLLDPKRDNGTYQCSASNVYGTTVTSAEIRVLSFQPTFAKNPLIHTMRASVGGNATIVCQPEAAPFPEFTWSKNGADLGVSTAPSRVTLLANGNLFISPVEMSDAGSYTCTATNSLGSDASSGYLQIQASIVINTRPKSRSVRLNDTSFLPCVASYPPGIDTIYVWKFNGRILDVDGDPFFGRGAFGNAGGLYIRNAQFEHEGIYTCVARTVNDETSAEATVTVLGPPAPPAGIYKQAASETAVSMVLRWTTTDDHGLPVLSYIIEIYPEFQKRWRVLNSYVDDGLTFVENELKRGYTVHGLKPGNLYQFRIRAINEFGVSEASEPSCYPLRASQKISGERGLGVILSWSLTVSYRTLEAPPSVAPYDVGGGGGTVGTLTMTWTPLNLEDLNGKGTGYVVYRRQKGGQENDWSKNIEIGRANKSVSSVGINKYYLPYEVKIQPFNYLGRGPNSSITTVYSAEGIPVGVVTGVRVNGYNETAMEVTWNIPEGLNSRQSAKGKIRGFQVNCWPGGISTPGSQNVPANGRFRRQYASPDAEAVIVIGVINGLYYYCNVQLYNTAGLGPMSDAMTYSSNNYAPIKYPTEIYIYSNGWGSVRICYRGVTTSVTKNGEEPLIGYRVRIWLAGDDIRSAKITECGRKSWCVINDLEPNNVYSMRAFAYSYGGDGRMSPTMYFTMGGTMTLDLSRYDLLATGSLMSSTLTVFFVSFIIHFSLYM